jgi:hypothetical protein
MSCWITCGSIALLTSSFFNVNKTNFLNALS